MSSLGVLEEILRDLSDGAWEHGPGMEIRSLDNPGWSITVALTGTKHQGLNFSPIRIERSETDWISARIEQAEFEQRFEIDCGVENLTEAVSILANALS